MRFNCIKNAVILICLFFVIPFTVIAETSNSSWVLAAEKFSYKQSAFSNSESENISSIIPQLILEQISAGLKRVIPNQETLNRKLSELQTERLSLFLQLSKEIKTRDALVLKYESASKLKKYIAEQEKVINEVQKKIDANIEETRKLEQEFEKDKNFDDANVDESKVSSNKKAVSKKTKESYEIISLYKDDSTALFDANVKKSGSDNIYTSYDFNKAVTSSNINGLLTGSIIAYGEYIAVTAELYVYPLALSLGSVMEVGLASESLQIARSLARSLTPKLANTFPVKLIFDVMPEDVETKITVDDIVYTNAPESILVDAGIHNISIEAENFNTESFTYNFIDKNVFHVTVNMVEKKLGNLKLGLKKSVSDFGVFYINSVYAGDISNKGEFVSVAIDGNNMIGQFYSYVKSDDGTVTEEKSSLPSYFYIPKKYIGDGNYLLVDAKSEDLAALIDKSRRRMYTGYTLLMLSLPFSFYSYGKFYSAKNSYELGYTSDKNEVNEWRNRTFCAMGISVAFGINFAVQLFRYLKTANKVVPPAVKKLSYNKILKENIIDSKIETIETETIDGVEDGKDIIR
ncbi:MAG: hypothetical protein K6F69_07100 [Treponema sp.]|nr:hypothetical protein [Treponema sp.]